MAKLHYVKRARKDHGKEVRRGQSYFWFKHKMLPRIVSRTKPKRSQLIRSEFLRALCEIEEGFDHADTLEPADLASELEMAAEAVEQLGQEQDEKRSNMPSSLQDSDTGQLLQTRAEECERLAEELRQAATECEDLEVDSAAQLLEMINWSID